ARAGCSRDPRSLSGDPQDRVSKPPAPRSPRRSRGPRSPRHASQRRRKRRRNGRHRGIRGRCGAERAFLLRIRSVRGWGVIILAATPIGNLGDASRRLVEALETCEIIAAEDTRTTVHLLRALGIENRPRLIALHEHNEVEKAAEVVELARNGDLLVLSDA